MTTGLCTALKCPLNGRYLYKVLLQSRARLAFICPSDTPSWQNRCKKDENKMCSPPKGPFTDLLCPANTAACAETITLPLCGECCRSSWAGVLKLLQLKAHLGLFKNIWGPPSWINEKEKKHDVTKRRKINWAVGFHHIQHHCLPLWIHS